MTNDDEPHFEDSDFNIHFHDFCADFEVTKVDSVLALTDILEAIARELAVSFDLRVTVGISEPPVWTDLRNLWSSLHEAQFASSSTSDDLAEEDLPQSPPHQPPREYTLEEKEERTKQAALRNLCGALAKFTRNLVAGVPKNQHGAFECEPHIRRLVHYHTSWTAMDDEDSFPVTRALAQTLSNMVTANEDLMSQLWTTYMNLPEPEVVIIRLLGSPDARTILAVFVLILNCIHENLARATVLSTGVIGTRVCVSLLDDMVDLYDAEEATDGARAFDVGYDIFSRLIESGLVPELYVKLSVSDEIVTPHQTTLLKLVDSYLQSTQLQGSNLAGSAVKTARIHSELGPLLLGQFTGLSRYAVRAIRQSLGLTKTTNKKTASTTPSPDATAFSDDSEQEMETKIQLSELSASVGSETSEPPPLLELDVMLPKVCEALVLVAQCMITVTLELETDIQDDATSKTNDDSSSATTPHVKALFIDSTAGVVESLVEVLRLLDLFLPRINFGKPVPTTPPSPAATPTQSTSNTADPTGFSYVKRDLVRLLGILCHGSKSVQNLVRDCGGIQVVMNLCVVDERNPYLREHAIFTLRNLLNHNPANQAVVDGVKPQGVWDENGVLQDTPGTVRK